MATNNPAGPAGTNTAALIAETKRRPLQVPGLIGPRSHPDAHGFKPGDHHVIVNDRAERAQAFAHDGRRVWELPALARGQGADTVWNRQHTDTPPGLYRSGTVYHDWVQNPNPGPTRDALAYGWVSIDLIELEGQEQAVGRAGVMVHGGGSGLGWPGAWAGRQPLLPTLGCIRMHNKDLLDRVVPLLGLGSLYWSVYQEQA